MQKFSRLSLGLFCLRMSLGLFVTMWALDKLQNPTSNIQIFSHLYGLLVSPSIVMILGAVELAFGLLFLLGINKTITYGFGLITQIVYVAVNFDVVLNPIPQITQFNETIPLLLAFIALFVMRDFDTKWMLGKKKSLFS